MGCMLCTGLEWSYVVGHAEQLYSPDWTDAGTCISFIFPTVNLFGNFMLIVCEYMEDLT